MDQRQSTIEYLDRQLQELLKERDRLSEQVQQINVAITSVSRTLDLLAGEGEVSMESTESDAGFAQPAKPDNLKRPQFRSCKLSEAILQVLRDAEGLGMMRTEDLIKGIYLVTTDDEERACRASLTAALHRMEKGGAIDRVQPGIYQLRLSDLDITQEYKEVTGRA